MTATISVEETIGKQFDTFYQECKLQDIELSEKLKRLLQNLEGDTITEATSEYTTEYHTAYVEGYDDGRKEGYDEGYEDGLEDGHKEGHVKGSNTSADVTFNTSRLNTGLSNG
jgi:flagellar biosynthesis/type III secretory pathway protein FliH